MRRRLTVLTIVAVVVAVMATPAAAGEQNDYHFTQHRMGAEFNNDAGRGTVQVYAAWYNPSADFGGGVGPAIPSVYVTYWGDRIGDDCTISQSFYDFEYHWSMSHSYVGVDTDCGYLELFLDGDRGAAPNHDWDHNVSMWNGQQWRTNVRNSMAVSDAVLLLDGEPVPVVLQSAGMSKTTLSVTR